MKFIISLIIGAAIGIFSLIKLYQLYVADLCLDKGGTYRESENLCILGPGSTDSFVVTLQSSTNILGIIVGIIIITVATTVIYKLIKIFKKNATKATT